MIAFCQCIFYIFKTSNGRSSFLIRPKMLNPLYWRTMEITPCSKIILFENARTVFWNPNISCKFLSTIIFPDAAFCSFWISAQSGHNFHRCGTDASCLGFSSSRLNDLSISLLANSIPSKSFKLYTVRCQCKTWMLIMSFLLLSSYSSVRQDLLLPQFISGSPPKESTDSFGCNLQSRGKSTLWPLMTYQTIYMIWLASSASSDDDVRVTVMPAQYWMHNAFTSPSFIAFCLSDTVLILISLYCPAL